ncbi:MAG: NTP transferase domain-containing protein [Treponema sp.]|nr:NTP transferase domain-containing protein [Treponema sp.]
MNKNEFMVLRALAEENASLRQRALAEKLSFSLGLVNKCVASLREGGYITEQIRLTAKANKFLNKSRPKNAIILAAGYGRRMVPINQNKPKALLTVDGKPLVERQIEQLQEIGITDITIVVGYLKEAFDYLTDKYGVKLIYNKYYAEKNNLFSLHCVGEKIADTYIVPCDIFCAKNPFSKYEHFTWYMVNELIDDHSPVRVTRNGNLDYDKNKKGGNTMVGIAFIAKCDAVCLQKKIKLLCQSEVYDSAFWEVALFEKSGIIVEANVTKSTEVAEINSYEQLRELDCYSTELQNESISVICDVFSCTNIDIKNIRTLKKGMTNRSYIFEVNNKRYIMRIPGEGTEALINRKEEAAVYNTIKGKGICDELFYINPENGMKISAFIENSRACDAYHEKDLKKCMKKLRSFHDMKLKTNHEFNIYEKIDFYESLWKERSIFVDYEETKKNALSLKEFIASCDIEFSLTHIDAVPDNFLFSENGGKETVQLIDWEYAGMQDPHVDIAMFCIYSLYKEKKDVDRLIDIYFDKTCTTQNRIKIYCYVSLCGLLWSNWCEYKRQLGVEFGEYSLMQYRYAKDYFKIATDAMKKTNGSQKTDAVRK